MRQHFTDDAGAEYPSYTKPTGALIRYAVGKTVHELLTYNDYYPAHNLRQTVPCIAYWASGGVRCIGQG